MAEVKIYSTPTCSNCKKAKEYFEENNIEYTEINVSEDKEARKYLMDNGYRGVPVISVDGEEFLGYDKAKLDELLKK